MEDDDQEFIRLQKKKKKLTAKTDLQELARVCNRCGEILYRQGKFEEALAEHYAEEEACNLARDILGVANAHRRIGECYAELGDYDTAIQHQKQHLELAVEANSYLEQQRAWATLGRTYLHQAELLNTANKPVTESGEFTTILDRAEDAFLKCFHLCSKLSLSDVGKFEIDQMKGRFYLNYGLVKDQRGDVSGCVSSIEKAIDVHKSHCQWDDLFRSHSSLSLIYLKYGDASNSLYHAEEALKVAQREKDVENEYEILAHKGRIQLHQERYGEAKATLRKCYKLAQSNGKEVKSARRLLKYARNLDDEKQQMNSTDPNNINERMVIYEKMGDLCSSAEIYKSAIDYYHLALKNSKLLGNTDKALAPLYVSLAQTYADDNQYEKAVEYYQLELKCWTNSPEEKCKTLVNLADCETRLSPKYETIVGLYNMALAEARLSGSGRLQKLCLKSLAEYQNSLGKSDDEKVTLTYLEEYQNVSSSDEESNDDSDDSSFLTESNDEASEKEESPKPCKTVNRSKTTHSLPIRRNEKGETLLHKACITNQISKVKRLIEQRHPVDIRDNSGWSPLHEAANYGHVEICRLLLENGATVNDRGGERCDGLTPLHDAAMNCHLHVMEVLLEHGGSLLAKNDKGMTPLDCLAEWRRSHKHDANPKYIAECLQFEEKLKTKLKDHCRDFKSERCLPEIKLPEFERNAFGTKQFKMNGNNEMELQTTDSESETPALVGENDVLPDCEDWIIDDISENMEKRQRKRRRCNILSFVERSAVKSSESSAVRSLNCETEKSPDKPRRMFKTRKRKRNIENHSSPPSSPLESFNSIDFDITMGTVENVKETLEADIGIRVNVKVLDTLFLIPVPQGETIGWLASEAAQRYFAFSGQKPKLVLSVKEGAVLCSDDKVNVILRSGDEVIANFQSWEILPIQERYIEACKSLKIDANENISGSLVIAESFSVASFAKCKMESLMCSTVLRAVHCLNNLREINMSGNYFEPLHLQLLASLLKCLPLLQSLDISNCDLMDSTLFYLVDHLCHKPVIKVEHLKIGYNPLLDEGCKNLLLLFRCLPNLTSVSMPSISTSSALCQQMCGKDLVESLSVLRYVRKLDLSYTRYPIAILLEIISTFSQMPLVELDLSSVVVKLDATLMCHSLCEWMREPTNEIRILHLSMCFLDDECIRLLRLGLQARNLDLLNVSGNRDLSSSSVQLLLGILPKEKLNITSCPNCTNEPVDATTPHSKDPEEDLEDFDDYMEMAGSPVF